MTERKTLETKKEPKKVNKTWQAIIDHQGAFQVVKPNLFL